MYLPPVYLFETAGQCAKWVIDAGEKYQKRSFRNSCLILTGNGLQLLTVPVRKGKTNAPIRDVAICYDEPWHIKHLRAIQTAYGNSPCFIHFFHELEIHLMQRHQWLWDLNLELLEWVRSTGIVPQFDFIVNEEQNATPHSPEMNRSNYGDFSVKPYLQLFSPDEFISNLSILDKLFQNCI